MLVVVRTAGQFGEPVKFIMEIKCHDVKSQYLLYTTDVHNPCRKTVGHNTYIYTRACVHMCIYVGSVGSVAYS